MPEILAPRSTLRQKRFRKYLFSEDELAAKAEELREAIAPIYRLWSAGTTHESEIAALYITSFLRAFRPRDFKGGPHGQALIADLSPLPPTVRQFAVNSFRSVPLAVNRALVLWAEGASCLKILDYVPDSLSVLKAQSAGERIVTCIFDPQKLTKHVEDMRDPLGFVLHDLIHADHFFRYRDWFEGQKEFYIETLARLERGDFSELLKDEKRARRFEYVISDMNSHPAHMIQTLNTI